MSDPSYGVMTNRALGALRAQNNRDSRAAFLRSDPTQWWTVERLIDESSIHDRIVETAVRSGELPTATIRGKARVNVGAAQRWYEQRWPNDGR